MLNIYAKSFMTATRNGEPVTQPKARPAPKKWTRWRAPIQRIRATAEH